MRCHLIICLIFSQIIFSQNDEQKFSLFFENGKYDLTSTHQKILDSIKSNTHKEELDVHIKGYTNNIGGEQYNLELSRKRAENVKAQLREFTIISSKGYGELRSDLASNRRVDILVHHKSSHVPEEGEIVELPKEVKTEEEHPHNFELDNILKKGDKITLDGIFFYPNRDVISNESKEALEELVKYLKKNSKITFKLIGHICCGDPMNKGKDLKNLRTGKNNLSEARARALHNYLAKKGINKKRMRYIGMAFRNSTGKGDEFDRRVEIEIISVQ